MFRNRLVLAAGVMALAVAATATTALGPSREELNKYKEKELKAYDFCLRDLDGKTHCLKDYLAKGQYVAIETGSST